MADLEPLVEPFTISVPDAELDDLRRRLRHSRWPDRLEGVGWEAGAEHAYLVELCRYWESAYDWRATERAINRWPNYTTMIDGQRLHFLHVRSGRPEAFPLLLLHGWPGSVVEFLRVIDLLARPGGQGPVFDLVCPSLPGYGWSSPLSAEGWGVGRTAAAMTRLMNRLGYQSLGVQGGDWGAIIATRMAQQDPESIRGLHLNMIRPPAVDPARADLSPEERSVAEDYARYRKTEVGYVAIQSTKPQSLGYGLVDSPVGLAAWITEKVRSWSDCGGDLESVFSKDELLANVSVYWLTRTGGSAARMYLEAGREEAVVTPVTVPTGVAVFPAEVYRSSRRWAEERFNVQRWTRMQHGGHFAAWEQPELLASDAAAFFASLSAR